MGKGNKKNGGSGERPNANRTTSFHGQVGSKFQRTPVGKSPSKQNHGSSSAPAVLSGNNGSKLSALQQKFAKKLEGSRFRVINERLYTTDGAVAFDEFQSKPSLFEVYHEGFRAQASQWPSTHLIV